MTDAARAELLARLKARCGGGRSNELPIPPPAELREHLVATIPHMLAAEPERIPDAASHKETMNQYLRKGTPVLVRVDRQFSGRTLLTLAIDAKKGKP